MITNVFMNPYEQPENKLTYSFLCLIEHLHRKTVRRLLGVTEPPISVPAIQSHYVDLLYGGGSSNPDGSMQIVPESGDPLMIFLESKTWRRGLDIAQVRNHLGEWVRPANGLLLVITSDEGDRGQLTDEGIRFITWNRLATFLHKLANEVNEEKDSFMLEQFVDYIEMCGEGWRAKMIDRALIDSFSQSLFLAKDVKRFYGEAWKLTDAVKDDVVAAFPGLLGTVEHRTNEGMTYVGGNLAGGASFLYLLFGICLDPTLSKIPFKVDFQPEYIVRLTMDKSDRTRLGEDVIFQETGDLVNKGFELNKGDPMRHPWTICLWHDPMISHAFDDVAELATLFKEKLNILFESQFFKHLRSISR